jgi:PAS domain S-box-containing protein
VKRLSIAARLYLLIGLSTLALLAVIGGTLVGSGKIVAAGRSLYNEGALAIEQTSRLALLFEEQEEIIARASAEVDRDRIDGYRARFDEVDKKLSDQLVRLSPVADALAENSAYRLAAAFGGFRQQAGIVFDLAQSSRAEMTRGVLDGSLAVFAGQAEAIMSGLLRAAATRADADVKALSTTRDAMIWTIVGVSLFGVAIFNGLGVYVARRLSQDLGRIVADMRALSAGDLDSQMAAEGDADEIAAMARAVEVFRFEMMAGSEMAAELRRSQEHLARAQQIARMGSDLRNLRTDEAEWSDELYRIFGVSRRDFVPSTENFLSLVHPDDRAIVLASGEQIAKGMSPDPIEYRIIRPDGGLRHIHREAEVIRDEAGNPAYMAGTCHDVTEIRAAQAREKELERQLMHSQKLEALGTLAGGVAHDLNNTLVPILALSKLALDELPESSVARSDIETIVQASQRARDLVKQILAFSRKQDLVKQEVDFAQVTRDALHMLRASVPTTIQIVDQILDVPPVFGDPGELHQVVVNVVTNAAQAIGRDVGRVTVRLWAASELSGEPGSAVWLSITDTGCGMDEATLDRIFEPFFTTKDVGDGTGLGLSVVHGIVTRHGGTITVRSKPGEGSEFTLTLPAPAQCRITDRVETAAA